jgi:hypothetical protein
VKPARGGVRRPRRSSGAGGLPGIVAGELGDYDLPDLSSLGPGPLHPVFQSVVERAANDFRRWETQVARTGYCSRPIRLRGKVGRADPDTGELVELYSTDHEPNRELLVACGNRRASKCRSCSFRYRGDDYQVVVSGLRGGKGVPESVVGHPMVFVTFTAPGFGAVHAHRERNGRVLPCRPRDRKKTCPHGIRLGCSCRHKDKDPRVGQPICLECFDAQGQVIWNAQAAELWARTTTYVRREVARAAGMTYKQFEASVKVRFAKVAEYQRRGALHFHAIVRLDAAPPADEPELVAPPPDFCTLELLEAGLRAARGRAMIDCQELAVLGRAESSIRWGTELDVHPIAVGASDLTAEVVAAYVAKYAVKFSEGMGLPDRPIESDADVDELDAPEHIKALVRAAWVLGWRHEFEDLKLREHAHGLGFGGHFLTKSRRYSTTMAALNEARRDYRRRERDPEEGADAWAFAEDGDQVVKLADWHYAGWGYHTIGEAYLASSAAARAREERRVAREELTSWVA